MSNQYVENDDNLNFISHPYLNLAQGIIAQAVIDKDIAYLISPQGQTLIDNLNLSRKEINSMMEIATGVKVKSNLKFLWRNKYVTIRELSQQTGIQYQTLYNRLVVGGLTVSEAVSYGSHAIIKKNYVWNGKPTTLADVSRATGINISTLYCRIHKSNMTVEEAVAKGKSRRK